MKSIEEFIHQKNNILELYKEIKNSDYLPVKFSELEITKDTIDDYIKSLKDERFVISVCGQMKVGKSTFLNNYIFENEILPSAATPETAKLTEINYGEKERCTVIFYSMQEWQDLKLHTTQDESGETVNYFDTFIKPAITKYSKRTGEIVYPETILAYEKKELDSLSELRDYVGADGKYTPFTKLVKIYYPSEKINGVTIVDTPGTNDPNKMRSKVTEEWIGKSDAVVFLMYAGKALSSTDVDFINQFLLPIPSEKILIGLSKVDAVEDYRNPKKYVENAIKKLSFAKTIENNEIYSIAPLFSYYPKLWKKYQNGEVTLSDELIEDIKFQLSERGEESHISELIEKDGLVKEFESAIQKTLIDNKGEGILKSHIEKIKSIFDYKIIALSSEHDLLKQKIELINKTDEEIEKERDKLSNENMNLLKFENEISVEYQNSRERVSKKIGNFITDGSRKLQDQIIDLIDNNDLKYLSSNFPYDARNKVEDFLRSSSFSDSLEKSFRDVDNSIIDMKQKLKVKIMNSDNFSHSFISNIFSIVHISNSIDKISSDIRDKFLNKMESFTVSKYVFFTNKDESKNKLKAEIKSFLTDENFKNVIFDEITSNLVERNNCFYNDIVNPLKMHLEEMQKNIREVKAKKSELSNNLKDYKLKIENISKEIKQIEIKKSDLLLKV